MPSPLSIPELWDDYREVADSIADLRALYERAQERCEWAVEVQQRYRARENGEARHKRAAETRLKWEDRRDVLQHMLDRVLMHPSDGFPPPAWEDLTDNVREKVLTSRSTKTRIAQGILHVLDEADERPPNQTRLLDLVDDFRGTSHRTTYRGLRRYEDDPPTSVDALEQWAREETGRCDIDPRCHTISV